MHTGTHGVLESEALILQIHIYEVIVYRPLFFRVFCDNLIIFVQDSLSFRNFSIDKILCNLIFC